MNKKQVGALLKVISKDTSREVLTTAQVIEWYDDIVLVGTDGYIMAMIKLDKEDAQPILGKGVRREALEKWYKLATGKSRLDTAELVKVFADDYAQHNEYVGGNYPDMHSVIDNHIEGEVARIAFNADYAKTLQDLSGTAGLTYKMHGKLGALIADTDMGKFVLMPLKS